MKNIILLFCYFLIMQQAIAQYTQVPDSNFEQALIDLGIDSEGILDGQFLTADAIGIIDLQVDNKNINDLTGIEAFVDLLNLNAFGNILTSINLSVFPLAFHSLFLSQNNLTTIDLTPVPNLVNLTLGNNNFTQIDASNLTHLASFFAFDNSQLTSINLTNCTNLQAFGFDNTLIETIDFSDCISLKWVDVQDNFQLISLDFTYNQNLEEVTAHNSTLTSINLPNNPDLIKLSVGQTQLTELDISNCPNLEELLCAQIGLSSLDIAQNTNLIFLSASFNQFTTINFSQNIAIKTIYINDNLITGNIDLSNNVNLENLNLSYNPIEAVDVSNSINLDDINVSRSQLTTIDLSENPFIEFANFFECPNLEFANIKNGENDTNLLLFIGTQCPNLSCVVVDDPLASNDNILVDANTTLVGNEEDCNLSISENELHNLMTIYPNPVQDVLYIDNNAIIIKKITVYDILGKVIITDENSFNQLNLSEIKTGIYYLKIETQRGVLIKKIMKL